MILPKNHTELRFRGVVFERAGKFGAKVERAFDRAWTETAILELFEGIDDAPAKGEQTLWAAAGYAKGASRGNAGIECLYAAVLDADCCDVGASAEVIAHLRARGVAFIIYG